MKLRWALAGSGALLTLCLSWMPVGTGLSRVGQVVGLAAVLAAWGLWVSSRARWKLCGLLGLLLFFFVVVPRRTLDEVRLRRAIAQEARALVGTPYLWGGETGRGVDCSGLVRLAWRRALLREALAGSNPGLLRDVFTVWFFDASAAALAMGYRGLAAPLEPAPRGVNGVTSGMLLPGDFMVTADGLHTMLFVGDGSWVEADPGVGAVIEEHVPSANGWFSAPAVLLRWATLRH